MLTSCGVRLKNRELVQTQHWKNLQQKKIKEHRQRIELTKAHIRQSFINTYGHKLSVFLIYERSQLHLLGLLSNKALFYSIRAFNIMYYLMEAC